MYDTSLSKICQGYGAKKIKDAYPKKVCHMLRHVKKKRKIKDAYPNKVCHMLRHVKKKEIAPYPKKRKNRDGAYKGVHTPSTKKISTHLHILIKVYDLFLLWIRFLT